MQIVYNGGPFHAIWLYFILFGVFLLLKKKRTKSDLSVDKIFLKFN